MILGTGVLNGTADGTIVLTDELMSGPGSSTTGVTHLINVVETTIVSMITRVLVALRPLSTDKVTTVLPGTLVAQMTDGCHPHPSLLS